MLLNVVITPLWYLLATEPGGLREPWDFLLVEGEYAVPLVLQLLLVELIIDVLKLASLNTPDVLGNSFSMLGALILGDFAVQSRWLVPEVLVYMAFVAVSNFAQHSLRWATPASSAVWHWCCLPLPCAGGALASAFWVFWRLWPPPSPLQAGATSILLSPGTERPCAPCFCAARPIRTTHKTICPINRTSSRQPVRRDDVSIVLPLHCL